MRRTAFYSPWWLSGAPLTSPVWAERDRAADPRLEQLDDIPMGQWLGLAEETRQAIVALYAHRTPKTSRLT